MRSLAHQSLLTPEQGIFKLTQQEYITVALAGPLGCEEVDKL